MKKLTKIITAVALTLGLTSLIALPTYAENPICGQSNVSATAKQAAGCPGYETNTTFQNSLQLILNSIIGILGVVAVIVIVIGGVNYMTSQGDPGKTKKAKDTILYASIGLIICVLAFAITNFVINAVNKATKSSADSDSSYVSNTIS